MAEEVQYASEPGSNKRKYEDPTSPSLVSRRRTGFSAPISSLSPADASAAAGTPPRPTSYNSVAPLMDDFELAKQKAQEIAARILNNSDPTKARANNNGGSVAFEAREPQKPLGSTFPPSGTSSYGYPGPTKKIEIPNTKVGVIIGRAGETIRNLQVQSGAKIQVTRDMDADPNSQTRGVELMGTPDQIAKAEQLIQDVLSEADSGSSGIASRRFTGQQIGSEQFVMRVPNNKVGLVIGKSGETIKSMQATTGARIQVIPLHLPPGDTSTERTVQIDGTSDQIEQAKQLVNEAISESRARNPGMTGTYPQQGYQTRPPNSWTPQMHQPGYGYMYPGQSPQFSMPQQTYPGYPPQPPAGGYGPGWDQSSQNQQTTAGGGGGGYDYYSQVPPQQQTPGGSGGQTDNSAAYGYGQPPSSGYNNQGQAYSQEGYGGGYNAPAPQSGYAGPSNYDYGGGNSSAPAPDGQAAPYASHGDVSEAPPQTNPSPNAKYPHQGTAQPGYGNPPTQPPVYGASNYGQPAAPTSQPAYGPAQSGYGQPDYGSQRPPSTGYGAPGNQTGYGPTPPYGVPPPMAQSGAAYNSGHGGSGYPQSSAYPPAGGAYDTAPASQSAGSAKTSPEN